MATNEDNKQKLVLSIVNFLQLEAENSDADKGESIEVAVQCLESAFGIDYSSAIRNNAQIVNLLTLFNSQAPQQDVTIEAEDCKTKGNELVRKGNYKEAAEQYTRAIELNPNNAVYFCNRAAAYSRLENHDGAVSDCLQAIRLDPNYAKAYGRLGIAYSSLKRYREAKDAYQQALNIDSGNSMYEENLKLAEEQLRSASLSREASAVPDPENVDIGQFVNNPNLLNMASQMLNDPSVRNMGHQLAQQMQVNNPAFVDNLRRQFSGEASSSESSTIRGDTSDSDDKKDEPSSQDKEDAPQ